MLACLQGTVRLQTFLRKSESLFSENKFPMKRRFTQPGKRMQQSDFLIFLASINQVQVRKALPGPQRVAPFCAQAGGEAVQSKVLRRLPIPQQLSLIHISEPPRLRRIA